MDTETETECKGGELDAWDLTPDPFPKGMGNL
jgi:hypothetical protein